MELKTLNSEEIKQLEHQGCRAEDWSNVLIHPETDLARIQFVTFRGNVAVGKLSGFVEVEAGRRERSSLQHVTLDSTVIADEVYLNDVGLIKNYAIGDGAAVERVNVLSVTGKTAFGNGVKIEVLNEGGGREMIIFDQLSAQIAYLQTMYRHEPQLIDALQKTIEQYVEEQKSSMGVVGNHARILRCNQIVNVKIGAFAVIRGAQSLENGTIQSEKAAPVLIGDGVIARNFVVLSGSELKDGALLTDCFVGQGVRIGRQFSAENSAFFANCEGFHSEAVSVFAGPYSVTHHKSTLLIAGMFSFYNAGSGTNQSNHMYKLGPVHQGILERGAKTGSFSYLLWPARVAPFTAVIGKHYTNFDAANLPFSYIEEVAGRTLLTPGMNLFTVGTRRDSAKWPKRDRRKGENKLDLIHFDLFSPFVVNRVRKGKQILAELHAAANKKQDFVKFKGLYLKRLLLKRGIKYYQMAMDIFVGEQLLRRLQPIDELKGWTDVAARLKAPNTKKLEEWYDWFGMFIPQRAAEELLDKIKSNQIKTVQDLLTQLRQYFERYDEWAWNWTAALLKEEWQIDVETIERDQFKQLISNWKNQKIRFNNLILSDAQKEFDSNSRIAYGIDGDEQIALKDFEAVRGTLEENGFYKELLAENEQMEKIAERLTELS
ncbi:DUF4954 family protein [Calditrichota bacterium LG25]